MTPRQIADSLVDKWRREFGVLCSDALRVDIAQAIRKDREARPFGIARMCEVLEEGTGNRCLAASDHAEGAHVYRARIPLGPRCRLLSLDRVRCEYLEDHLGLCSFAARRVP